MRAILLFCFIFCFKLLSAQSVTNAPLAVYTGIEYNDWCQSSSGSMSAIVSGGVAPFVYSWSNGATSSNINLLTWGDYTVTVTDSTGATATATGTIENIDPPPFYILEINQAHPGMNDGVVYTGLYGFYTNQAFILPGTFEITLLDSVGNTIGFQSVLTSWPAGPVYPKFDSLPPGHYSISCWQNTMFCVTTYSFDIKEIPAVNPVYTSSASCNGTPTGKITGNLHQSPSINAQTFNMNVNGNLQSYTNTLIYKIKVIRSGVHMYTIPCLDSLLTIEDLLPGNYTLETWTMSYDALFYTYYDTLLINTSSITVADDLTCSVVKGTVFADYNSNCAINLGDSKLRNVLVELNPGGLTAVTNSDGEFFIPIQNGTYTLTQHAPFGYKQLCPDTASFTIVNTTPGSIFNVAVADSISFAPDGGISMAAATPRPGFDQGYSISYHNVNPALIPAATISFSYDTTLSFVSATPTPTSNSGGLITWNAGSLSGFGSQYYNVVLNVPPTTSLGTTLESSVSVTAAPGETNVVNNADTIVQTVTGSFDPNDISVSPQGYSAEGYITNEEVLKYTVRFQNTGTDTAFNVMIVDTLPVSLDKYSVQVLNASHMYWYEVANPNVVVFHFDNLLLPDSNVNEQGSHGYIKYSLTQVAGNLPGTVIPNEADIYFDFNAPVITNEVKNTIYDCSTLLLSVQVNPLSTCEGNTIDGNVSLLFEAPLEWTLDSVYYSADTAAVFLLDPGVHTITATVVTNQCSASTTQQVVLFENPEPLITQISYILHSNYTSGNQWYFFGSPIPGATDSTFMVLQNGYYSLEVTDANGCTGISDSVFIVITSSQIDNSFPSLFIIPNPAVEYCMIMGYLPETNDVITLTDAFGRSISETIITHPGTELRINTEDLEEGIYFINVNSRNFKRTLRMVKH